MSYFEKALSLSHDDPKSPYYRGPFTLGNQQWYHFYCPEINQDEDHWASQNPSSYMFMGFNPTYEILDDCYPQYIAMFRPIMQRYRECYISNLEDEIADRLIPDYELYTPLFFT